MFTLINSVNLKVILEPVQTSAGYPSVAFDITLVWETISQTTKVDIKECWFANYDLNQFQENLQPFLKKQTSLVKLVDMSSEPILQFNRVEEDRIFFEAKVDGRFPIGMIKLKTEIENDELVKVLERMRNWAKWW